MPSGAARAGDGSQPDFQALFECAPGLYVVCAPDLRIVAASDAYLQATGTYRDAIMGRHICDLVPERTGAGPAGGIQDLRASLERVLATGAADVMPIQRCQIRVPGGEEERFWRRVNSPVRHGSGVAFIIHAIEDVTDIVRARDVLREGLATADESLEALAKAQLARARALDRAREKAAQACHAKDEFLSVVSHELRTPLNVIQGWLWQLRRAGGRDDIRQRALEIIDRNVTMQARLVDDLLDTSRAAIGKLHLRRQLVDLAQSCQSALESIERHAQAKGLAVTFNAPEAPLFVSGDADRLQQVVSNLLSNALKFTPAGGAITLTARREGTRARVTVQDTGIGVPPEFLPVMFEPFSQADRSTTRLFGGLGLGLTIVKQIMTLHGGEVTAVSDGRHGTTVSLDLPIPAVLEEPEERARRRDSFDARERPLAGVTVLVVDDEVDACEAVRLVLEDHGATVRTAYSGAEALSMLADLAPDVVVADLAMPDMDGYRLVRKMRTCPTGAHVPVIALTAYTDAREQAMLAGFQQFTSKPIPPADLVVTVVERLRERSAH